MVCRSAARYPPRIPDAFASMGLVTPGRGVASSEPLTVCTVEQRCTVSAALGAWRGRTYILAAARVSASRRNEMHALAV